MSLVFCTENPRTKIYLDSYPSTHLFIFHEQSTSGVLAGSGNGGSAHGSEDRGATGRCGIGAEEPRVQRGTRDAAPLGGCGRTGKALRLRSSAGSRAVLQARSVAARAEQ